MVTIEEFFNQIYDDSGDSPALRVNSVSGTYTTQVTENYSTQSILNQVYVDGASPAMRTS